MLLRLQLLSTGEFFTMARDGSLTIDLNSTFFNQQTELIGSVSYPGKMPLIPNQKIIQNAQLISTPAGLRIVDVMMWLGYLPWKQVKMYFTIENTDIVYSLYIDLAYIANKLKTLQLNQLYLDSDSTQVNVGDFTGLQAYMNATVNDAIGAHPMVFFPYKNDGAYVPAAYNVYPDYVNTTNYPTGYELRYGNRIYKITGNTTHGQTPLSNPELFADITISPDIFQPVNQIINQWETSGEGEGYFRTDVEAGRYSNTQTPFFLVTFAIKRICKFLGYTWEGRWMTEESANRITIFSNIPVGYNYIIADFTSFMPGILVTDFIKELRTQFGLLIDFDQTRKVAVVESLANIEQYGEIVDLRPLQTVSYRESSVAQQAFTITQVPDDKDQAYSDAEKQNLPVLQIGNVTNATQITDITLLSVTTKMIPGILPSNPLLIAPTNSDYRIPYIKMPVFGATPMDQISSIQYADRTGFKLRFLYYYGLVADGGGYLYPYGSSDNLDVNGQEIGNVSLALNNVAADVDLPIADYYNFLLQSKPFEMVFYMTAQKFSSIRANSRILVHDFNLATITCILSQNSADFVSDKDLITAKVTLYPIPSQRNTSEITPPPIPVVPPTPVDNGVVYVKFVQSNNTQADVPFPPPTSTVHYSDFTLYFFADAAGTTPKAVTALTVKVQVTYSLNNAAPGTPLPTLPGQPISTQSLYGEYVLSCNGTSAVVAVQAVTAHSQAVTSPLPGVNEYDYYYTLMASALYHVIP
jgi:hypothetical protein